MLILFMLEEAAIIEPFPQGYFCFVLVFSSLIFSKAKEMEEKQQMVFL